VAVDAFLKLEGVKGESVDKAHKEEIDVLSWGWGMNQLGTAHRGTGGGAGKVAVNDLTITKYVDRSTPTLIQACCTGEHYPTATLSFRKAGGEPLDYFIIKLEDVIVSSVNTGGSGGDLIMETITFNFARFKVTYQPQNAKGGKEGGAIEAGYNIATNEKI